MPLATWLAFALAALVMGLIPGPGVTCIVGYALSSGRMRSPRWPGSPSATRSA